MMLQVQGEGVQNVYRAKPLLGKKVPLGMTYQPQIEIYNPFDHVLKIQEVFTNEGFLHLGLPHFVNTNPEGDVLWEEGGQAGAGRDGGDGQGAGQVAPYKTTKVISMSFHGSVPGRHTGFVHVRTAVHTIIIPVEVQVMKGGLHCTPEVLDFETLTSATERREQTLYLLNASPLPVAVKDVTISSPDPQLQIVFNRRSTVLQPNVEGPIATVVYFGSRQGQFVGKLVVRTNDTSPGFKGPDVPYKARVMHGHIAFSQVNTTFPVVESELAPLEKTIVITNKFPVPFRIYSAVVESNTFQVMSFTVDAVIAPNEDAPPIRLRFTPDAEHTLFTSALTIHTNLTALKVPLRAYHGKLELSEPGGIDCGLVSVNDIKTRYLNISNLNPVAVRLLEFKGPQRGAASVTISIESVRGDDGKDDSASKAALRQLLQGKEPPRQRGDKSKGWQLAAGRTVCLRIDLLSSQEETVEEDLVLRTENEVVRVGLRYRSLQGRLTLCPGRLSPCPSLLQFPPTFPGRVRSEPIWATSTYGADVNVTALSSTDPRLVAVLSNTTLVPGVPTCIGYITFDPSQVPLEENYLAASVWEGLVQGSVARWSDLQQQERLEALWDGVVQRSAHMLRSSVVIETDIVLGNAISIEAQLSRPEILPAGPELHFSLTQVGRTTGRDLRVHNPSDLPMVAQLLLPPPADAAAPPGLPCASARACVADSTFVAPLSMVEVVPPHSVRQLGPIFYLPKTEGAHRATVYLRTNLTLLTPIALRGEGGSGKLVFAEGTEACPTLMFHFNSLEPTADEEVHVPDDPDSPPSSSKNVTIRNTGTLPIDVHALVFGGGGCHWDGLQLHDCGRSFSLGPGHNTTVPMWFEPDCTSARVHGDLLAYTSVGTFRTSVVAVVPPDILQRCYRSRSRAGPLGKRAWRTSVCLVGLVCVALLLLAALQLLRDALPQRQGCELDDQLRQLLGSRDVVDEGHHAKAVKEIKAWTRTPAPPSRQSSTSDGRQSASPPRQPSPVSEEEGQGAMATPADSQHTRAPAAAAASKPAPSQPAAQAEKAEGGPKAEAGAAAAAAAGAPAGAGAAVKREGGEKKRGKGAQGGAGPQGGGSEAQRSPQAAARAQLPGKASQGKHQPHKPPPKQPHPPQHPPVPGVIGGGAAGSGLEASVLGDLLGEDAGRGPRGHAAAPTTVTVGAGALNGVDGVRGVGGLRLEGDGFAVRGGPDPALSFTPPFDGASALADSSPAGGFPLFAGLDHRFSAAGGATWGHPAGTSLFSQPPLFAYVRALARCCARLLLTPTRRRIDGRTAALRLGFQHLTERVLQDPAQMGPQALANESGGPGEELPGNGAGRGAVGPGAGSAHAQGIDFVFPFPSSSLPGTMDANKEF